MDNINKAKPLDLDKLKKVTYGITGLTALAFASLWIGVGPSAGLSLKESLLGGVVSW